MINVVIEMPTWAPESWNDKRAMRPLHELVTAPAGAGIRVDRAALQRGQRELGGDEHRGAGGEHEKRQQRRARCTRRSSRPHRECAGPSARPTRGGSPASADGSWIGRSARSPTRSGASTGACGTGSLSRRRVKRMPMLAVSVARRPHHPVGSGWPSANPAADCTPSTTLSWSSAMFAAPT